MAEKPEKQLEELSSEQLREQIEQDKKQVRHSFFMSLTALIAIIALCIAWFVANNIANAGTSSISGKSDQAFLLASVGSYTNLLNKDLGLTEGADKQYSTYYDLEDGKTVTESQRTYHTGTADLMWYLNRNDKFSPGSSGKLEFYIIPQFDGLKQATFTLTLTAYKKGTGNKPSISEDTHAQDLINGHILLFGSLDNSKGYSNWLYDADNSNKLTVTAPGGGTFVKDQPYKITVYWVWPKYFRNYIYGSRYVNGDLFTDITTENKDYTKLVNFVNQQKTYNTSKLFYSTTTVGGISGEIGSSMSESLLNTCSDHYDAADEYIGSNVNYVYINASLFEQ